MSSSAAGPAHKFPNNCSFCLAKGALKKCGQCKAARYCSADCQVLQVDLLYLVFAATYLLCIVSSMGITVGTSLERWTQINMQN